MDTTSSYNYTNGQHPEATHVPLRLDELIERLQALRERHGGHIGTAAYGAERTINLEGFPLVCLHTSPRYHGSMFASGSIPAFGPGDSEDLVD